MKVYYVGSQHLGCYYVRCLIPLQNNGWQGDRISLYGKELESNDKAKAVLDSDVVVFHRPDNRKKLEMARMLKQAGKTIVYDNDDTYKDDPELMWNEIYTKLSKNLDNFIKEADIITCSTEFLKKEYQQLTDKEILVLPNLVDPDDWDEPIRNGGDKIRIGIVGSTAFNGDYTHIKGLLQELSNDSRVQLVLFSLPKIDLENNPITVKRYEKEYKWWHSLNIEWTPFVEMKDYFDTLNKMELDIMLIPRRDNYFNRCKSNLKFLEASMLEIPVIAQDFTDHNSPYYQDKDYLLLANTEDEWRKQVYKLINDKELRQKQGKCAKIYILEKYNAKTKANQWKYAYKR